MQPIRILLLFSVLVFGTETVRADVMSIPAQKDAMIFGTSGNADTGFSSGKGPGMFAGADGSLNRKRSLMQFDIAANVPPGAQITGVQLTLILGQVAGSGAGGAGGNVPTRTINLFALQQDWGEGDSGLIGMPPATSPTIGGSGQGYPRVTGDTGWDYALFDSANTTTGKWNAGGPDLHGGNFAAVASASSTFSLPYTNGNPYTWSGAGLVADAQAWLDAPLSNHGWLLKAMNGLDQMGNPIQVEDTPTSFLGFWTKDGAAANNNAALAPKLTITYVVPEPASLAIMLAALSVCGLRRR
jgi:hypothetical protein